MVQQMTDLLKASSSSQGVEQARALIPQAIPGYYALSPEARLAELGELRDRLVSTGQPAEVADDIARPLPVPSWLFAGQRRISGQHASHAV